MTVRIEREAPEETKGFGVLEPCCFCFKGTPWWAIRRNVAVCPSCAEDRIEAELPRKETWCESVSLLVDIPRSAPVVGPASDASVAAQGRRLSRAEPGMASQVAVLVADCKAGRTSPGRALVEIFRMRQRLAVTPICI